MAISFIITTYNIQSYIERCLTTVAQVVRAGDQVLIIDDGSSDETPDVVRRLIARGAFAADIEVTPIFFGENTMGGVGIAGNIGMDKATRDTVFFVDGDDWLDVEGFQAARAVFEERDCDILIANYQEYDEQKDTYRAPADASRWDHLNGAADLHSLRQQALDLIAVPWRKFYRRSFLEAHKLRFPEWDFFFEDNPFHWDVCLAAEQIVFANSCLCYHRVNRPGQTMASTGRELMAFFDHFDTIRALLKRRAGQDFDMQALAWIIGNMSWHIGRLHPKIVPFYFQRAQLALKDLPEGMFDQAELQRFQQAEVHLYVSLLQERGWTAALEFFMLQRNQKTQERLHEEQKQMIEALAHHMHSVTNHVTALSNAQYYEALHGRMTQ